MNPGVNDAEGCLVKVAADAGKQIGLVWCVDQHLQAFANGGTARAHHRRGGLHVARELFGVPGDVGGVVAHKVAHVQRGPQRLVRFKGQGVERQVDQGVALAAFYFGVGVGRAATEHAHGVAVQVFEQLALPGVPHLGRGTADVGHGEQVQGGEIALVTHALGKFGDHRAVAQVRLLRNPAHGQVFSDQKFDQRRVLSIDAVLLAKAPRLHTAQFRMVAAAPFGNVVEECCHIQQPGLVPARGQLRAKRVFVRMLDDKEAPHIAQHRQDVLVHRVDVEQVVLHLPDDAPKHPQIAPQHRGLVHQAHGVGDAAGLHQDGHKGGAVDRVAAKAAVHQAARVVQGAQGAGGQTLDAYRGLIQQKGFQNRVRLALVQVVAGHVQHAGFVVKAFVNRAQRVGRGVEPLLDVHQQNQVELGYRLGRPVVALHQCLTGAHQGAGTGAGGSAARGHIAKGLGHRRLQVKHQPVFAPLGGGVQARTNQKQERLVALDLLHLKSRGQTTLGQIRPVLAQARGLGHPQDCLQVANTAGRLFAIGL